MYDVAVVRYEEPLESLRKAVEMVDGLAGVDVLCTHAAPAVPQLSGDVVAGASKHSKAVLQFLVDHRPDHHYFGDVHQPQATTWRVGQTWCHNVGYFRATGRPLRHG